MGEQNANEGCEFRSREGDRVEERSQARKGQGHPGAPDHEGRQRSRGSNRLERVRGSPENQGAHRPGERRLHEDHEEVGCYGNFAVFRIKMPQAI